MGPSASSLRGLFVPSPHGPLEGAALWKRLRRGASLSEQEGYGNLAFMSPATKAPPWAHWSQMGKIQEVAKPRKQQVWIQSQLSPSFLILRPHSASMS